VNPTADDTAPDAAAEQRRLLMARTPDERIAMMVAMWRDALSVVESRLIADGVVEPAALRVGLFRQIYASDFDAPTLDRIARRIAAAALSRPSTMRK
jgi:hypothetical protein